MNKFGYRKGIIAGIIITVCVIYIIRLFTFQVADDYYKIKADNISQRIVTQYPARGLIYDRNNKVLVDNQAAYDLIITPRLVKAFDTTELINILGITREYLEKQIAACKTYSRFRPSVLISQITSEKYAVLQEKLYRYPGFDVQIRTLRKYNVNHSGGVFGYVSEVSMDDIRQDNYYAVGDYIGTTGLEKTYEKLLRGEKGKKILLVDNHSRIKSSYADGAYDEEATVGENLYTTLDADLQEYAVRLLQNKRGAIVAIEPKTGEILAKVSNPGYDPRLMVGLDRGKNYSQLYSDEFLKPLFDRSTNARYAPGSIFKPLQALIGLQTKAISVNTQFHCSGKGTMIGPNRSMGCHSHKSPLDLRESIEHSCNPYYAYVFQNILKLPQYKTVRDGYIAWREYVLSFGLGSRVAVDLFEENSGSIPTPEYYDKTLKTQRWHPMNIISLAIGQGELLITPIQMANMAAIIANKGYYISPHLVRPTNDSLKQKIVTHKTKIDPVHFSPVIEGMEQVILAGTGRNACVDSIRIAGKTGTVQNVNKDHSVFIAFAPIENPKIALAVYIENGEWGSRFAAPIAGLLIEKYLKGDIPEHRKAREKEMFDADLINVDIRK